MVAKRKSAAAAAAAAPRQQRSSGGGGVWRMPTASAYEKYFKQRRQLVGRGGGGDQFGQIYRGIRFPEQQQYGSGFGTFLTNIVRGISGLIEGTPTWVKTGAKIAAKSALQGLSDYAGDVQVGVDPKVARSRAFRSTMGEIMEKTGAKMKGQGGRKRKKQKGGAKKKKKRCCRLKRLSGGGGKRRRTKKKQVGRQKRKKGIKARRSKFDLFSSVV
jgi:hypothetical protein